MQPRELNFWVVLITGQLLRLPFLPFSFFCSNVILYVQCFLVWFYVTIFLLHKFRLFKLYVCCPLSLIKRSFVFLFLGFLQWDEYIYVFLLHKWTRFTVLLGIHDLPPKEFLICGLYITWMCLFFFSSNLRKIKFYAVIHFMLNQWIFVSGF